MHKDWTDFKQIHGGIEAARARFENTCDSLFRKLHPNERVDTVKVKQGDGGIDVFIGEIGVKPIAIIQCKFFLESFGESQKKQIRDSFKSVIENEKKKTYQVKEWILCVPREFDIDQHKSWSGWKSRTEKQHSKAKGFIKLKSGNELLDLLKENDLYNETFKIEDSKKINEIHKAVIGKPETINLCVTMAVLSQNHDESSIVDYCLLFQKLNKTNREIQGFLFSSLPPFLHYSESNDSYELNGDIPVEIIKEILINDDLALLFMKSDYRKNNFGRNFIKEKLKNKIRDKATIDFICYACQFCPKTLFRIINSSEADDVKSTGFTPLKNDLSSELFEDFFSYPEILLEPDILDLFNNVYSGIESTLIDQLTLMQLAAYHKVFDYAELSSKYMIQDNPIFEDKSKNEASLTLNMTFKNIECEITPPELFLASYRSGIALELNSNNGLKLNIKSEDQPDINGAAQSFKIEPHGASSGNRDTPPIRFGQLDFINDQYIFKIGKPVAKRPANHPLQISLKKAVKECGDKLNTEYTLKICLKYSDCRQAHYLCQAYLTNADVVFELLGGSQVMKAKNLPFEELFNDDDVDKFVKLYEIQEAYGQEIPYPYESISHDVYEAIQAFDKSNIESFVELVLKNKKHFSSQEICVLENDYISFFNNLSSLKGIHQPRLDFTLDMQSIIDENLDDSQKDMSMQKPVSTSIDVIKEKSKNDFDLLRYIKNNQPVKAGNDLFKSSMNWNKEEDSFWYFDTPFIITMTKLNNSGWEHDFSLLYEKNDHKRMVYVLKKIIEFEIDSHKVITHKLNLSWHYFELQLIERAIDIGDDAIKSDDFQTFNASSKFLLFNKLGLYYLSQEFFDKQKSEEFYKQAEALLHGLQVPEFNELCSCAIDDLERFSSLLDESAQDKLKYIKGVQNTPGKYELIDPQKLLREEKGEGE